MVPSKRNSQRTHANWCCDREEEEEEEKDSVLSSVELME